MLMVMVMQEAMETNKKEAWSDGKHGIEVEDKDYYASSVAQISTRKAIIMIMLIIFIFCNIFSSLNLWWIFLWNLEFRYLCELHKQLGNSNNIAIACPFIFMLLMFFKYGSSLSYTFFPESESLPW